MTNGALNVFFRKLQLSVVGYEDRVEKIEEGSFTEPLITESPGSNGMLHTVYIVEVNTPSGHQWQLYKRYSDFSNLYYTILSDTETNVFDRYRFPNKSIFNTFSEFTKIRRK